jgi:HEAT repeat protein
VISERTRALIKHLQELPPVKKCFGGKTEGPAEQYIQVINKIAEQKEWQAVAYLVPFVLSPEPAIVESAAGGVESLLSGTPPTCLLQLDADLRAGFWSLTLQLGGWETVKVNDLVRSVPPEKQAAVVGVASFHRSGYVRQAALKHLSLRQDGKELTYLLIRLSDWVPQVRQVAEQAVEERIRPDYLRHFAANMVLLQRLKQRQRGAEAARRFALIERVEWLLQQQPHRRLLLDELACDDRELRRTCLRLLLENRGSDCQEIIERIIADTDLANRRLAVELAQDLPPAEQLKLLKQMAQDRAACLRRQALGGLWQADPAEGRQYLQAALLDTSPLVRDYARWKLAEEVVGIDFREFYLEKLTASKTIQTLAAAAAGLGETGSLPDACLLTALLDHECLGVRKTAIRAISRLDAAGHRDTFLHLLSDPAPGVSSESGKALLQTIDRLRGDSIWDVLSSSTWWHVKRNSLRLLNVLGKWERISYLLPAALHDDQHLQELAMRYIESWELRYRTTWQYSMPGADEKARFVEAMSRLRGRLPERVERTLQQCLKSFSNGS